MEASTRASAVKALPPRMRFPGLSSAAFEHPADRAALEALRRTPGLDRLLRWLSQTLGERYLRMVFTADSVRVSPRQCSRLYNDLREACAILDVTEPEIYVVQLPFPNAFTFGIQRFTIVMTTGLIDLVSDSERLDVVGHELGHIKSEHMLYRTMALVLAQVLSSVTRNLTIPGTLLTVPVLYALLAWFRKSELTADRAGLLTVQDPETCVSALLKLAGGSHRLLDDLNPGEFVHQADTFEDMDEDPISVYLKFVLVSRQTHPFPAFRAREVKEWSEGAQYRRLLSGDYPRVDTDAGKRTCAQCGAVVLNVAFTYCPECGAPLGPAT